MTTTFRCFHSLTLAIVSYAFSTALCPPAAAADPPQLFFDTEFTSMSFTDRTFALPLGPGWSSIDTTISATKAQDHNSSRSNKTASISPGDPDNPDPVDPRRLDGTNYQIESVIDLIFNMALESTEMSPYYGGGGGRIALTFNPSVPVSLPTPAPRIFDASAPDFGLLGSADSTGRALDHRGHVTVLKVSLGGDQDQDGELDELTIAQNGLALVTVPGTDSYSTLPDGRLSHTFDVALSMSGTIGDAGDSFPFSFGPLLGTITEVGQLSNSIVPEPSALLLVASCGLMLLHRRQTRRSLN